MIIAIDIGGTKTLLAVFDEAGNIVDDLKFPTPKDYATFKKLLADNVAKLSTNDFTSGTIGVRGIIDRQSGILVTPLSQRMSGWDNVNIVNDSEELLSCPLLIENDSKLAGLSEAIHVSVMYSKVLYITISTGIGSAFIINGKIDPDTINSEIGKTIYPIGDKFMKWEDFASGKAIVEKYHKKAADIDDPETWHKICRDLSLGIIGASLAFTPEVIILGGSVGSHFDKFKQPLLDSIDSIRPLEIEMPPIIQAKYPEKAVVYGCYALAKEHNGTDQ